MDDSTRYQRNIARGMERAWEGAETEEVRRDLEDLHLVIFSDHHRGLRGKTDDFRLCEQAYCAALGYYLEQGYDLHLLGDVEELWGHDPRKVMETYPETLALEEQFLARGVLYRYWGNHDDLWSDPRTVDELLRPAYKRGIEVREALRLVVEEEGKEVGTLFLAHGHQGEFWSDRHGKKTRWFVRTFWRPYKRLSRTPSSTPATDNRLRKRHNIAMYLWARTHPGMALIAGHTHKPVFLMHENVEAMRAGLEINREDRDVDMQELARERADLEWVRAGQRHRFYEMDELLRPLCPCYFNTGCCSFADGEITGIEITEGRIRLVQWPDDRGRPRPRTLASADLREVLGDLR
ncbi:MAG: hypothetical protein R6W82_06125 [bacterium]